MLTDLMQRQYLKRIANGLNVAAASVKQSVPGSFAVTAAGTRDVTTEVDRKINDLLRASLQANDEGWLSEEDADDKARLLHKVVWVVDPIDGTREFVDGIPEWCISVGLVIGEVAVAGGIYNPATRELFLGSLDLGVTYNRKQVRPGLRTSLDNALVLASRQEHRRGEWVYFEGKQFCVRPMGSIAYKLALVSAGLADATWTMSPKHEWDIAAGVALVKSAGGYVDCVGTSKLRFNQDSPLLSGVVAAGRGIWTQVLQVIDEKTSGR